MQFIGTRIAYYMVARSKKPKLEGLSLSIFNMSEKENGWRKWA